MGKIITYVSLFLICVNPYAYGLGRKVDPQNKETIFRLTEGKWKETCFESKLGMIISYSFSANEPVNFNIHWHKEKHVTYSVKHEAIKKLEGSFEPSIKQTYCLSWYASKEKSVEVRYLYNHQELKMKK